MLTHTNRKSFKFDSGRQLGPFLWIFSHSAKTCRSGELETLNGLQVEMVVCLYSSALWHTGNVSRLPPPPPSPWSPGPCVPAQVHKISRCIFYIIYMKNRWMGWVKRHQLWKLVDSIPHWAVDLFFPVKECCNTEYIISTHTWSFHSYTSFPSMGCTCTSQLVIVFSGGSCAIDTVPLSNKDKPSGIKRGYESTSWFQPQPCHH